jgi:hypothetical protein
MPLLCSARSPVELLRRSRCRSPSGTSSVITVGDRRSVVVVAQVCSVPLAVAVVSSELFDLHVGSHSLGGHPPLRSPDAGNLTEVMEWGINFNREDTNSLT